jgi:hypothetical protein
MIVTKRRWRRRKKRYSKLAALAIHLGCLFQELYDTSFEGFAQPFQLLSNRFVSTAMFVGHVKILLF